MSDQQQSKAGEAAKSDAVNLDNYVSKDVLDQTKAELQKAQQQLLSPEYIDYLESKKKGSGTQDDKISEGAAKVSALLGELSPEEIESLPKTKLLALAEQRAGMKAAADVRKEFSGVIKDLTDRIGNMAAYLELREVKEKHDDFDTYKEDVQNLLNSATSDLSIEDAYYKAKMLREAENSKKGGSDKATNEDKAEAVSKGSEKPDGEVPPNEGGKKEYKTPEEAGTAAWKEVSEKYGIRGDKI